MMIENSDEELLNIARDVLRVEAAALADLSANIPADFVPAIHAIMKTQGRVIISGMGKSGQVARKFSATLASTGTPSHYVHPADASHGDLGMISRADILILLSNSGETSELGDILAHARRFSIPVIAISSNPDSTLMRAADFQLTLPPFKEACSIGMAPTTSTTLMMALGDAMAVALMKKQGFRAENFHDLHPGGQLGAKLATLRELMHHNGQLPMVDAQASMQDAILEMSSKGFGFAVVIENDALMGVISDGDLRRHMDQLLSKTAGEIANRRPVTASVDLFAVEALAMMNEKKINVLVVVDENERPVGIIHIHDLLRAGVA